MTGEKRPGEAGATELSEEDLAQAQGGEWVKPCPSHVQGKKATKTALVGTSTSNPDGNRT